MLDEAPVVAADVLLDAAVAADADQIVLNTIPRDRYVVAIERSCAVVASAIVPRELGEAIIGRLAVLAGVDFGGEGQMISGLTPIRCDAGERDLVLRLRPGAPPVAEAMLLRRRRGALAVPLDELAPGRGIGGYRIVDRLGGGGMGTVYRVEHTALGRTYALKVLKREMFDSDDTSIARFLLEARAAARVRHPNIVYVFDFGYLADGRPYLVMELLDGESLETQLARGAPTARKTLGYARQLASALAAAHAHGVVHGDVSPANVFTCRGGAVKLVDFGLAQLDDPTAPAFDGPVIATPYYVAPERVRGGSATPATDQYSFGIVLYELLTGMPPFREADVRDLCLQHLHSTPPALDLPDPAGAALSRIARRCLAKSAVARFADMSAVVKELDAVETLVEEAA
jgi:serine/threonine protein kinase